MTPHSCVYPLNFVPHLMSGSRSDSGQTSRSPHLEKKHSLWPRLLSDHLLRTLLYYVCLGGCAECLIKYEYFFQIGWCLMCIYCMNTYRFLLLFISLQCEKLFSNAQKVTVSLLPSSGREEDTSRERQMANTMCRQGKLEFL